MEITISVGDPQGNRFEEPGRNRGHRSHIYESAQGTAGKTGSDLWSVPSGQNWPTGVPCQVDVGRTIIRLEGQEFPTPLIFGEQGERPLLEVIALEDALLDVDPTNRRLVPTNLLEL